MLPCIETSVGVQLERLSAYACVCLHAKLSKAIHSHCSSQQLNEVIQSLTVVRGPISFLTSLVGHVLCKINTWFKNNAIEIFAI